jgi:hypothetical protein
MMTAPEGKKSKKSTKKQIAEQVARQEEVSAPAPKPATVQVAAGPSFKEQMAKRPMLLKKLLGFVKEAAAYKKYLRLVVGFRFEGRSTESNFQKAMKTIAEIVSTAREMSTDSKKYLAPHKIEAAVTMTERVAHTLHKTFDDYIANWPARADRLLADIKAGDPEIIHREGKRIAADQEALRSLLLDVSLRTGDELEKYNETKIAAYNTHFEHLYELSREAFRLMDEANVRHEREEIVEISSELDDVLKGIGNL